MEWQNQVIDEHALMTWLLISTKRLKNANDSRQKVSHAIAPFLKYSRKVIIILAA